MTLHILDDYGVPEDVARRVIQETSAKLAATSESDSIPVVKEAIGQMTGMCRALNLKESVALALRRQQLSGFHAKVLRLRIAGNHAKQIAAIAGISNREAAQSLSRVYAYLLYGGPLGGGDDDGGDEGEPPFEQLPEELRLSA